MTGRYDLSGNPEAEFEPGSGDRVLRNLMGIWDPGVMDTVELDLLDQLYDAVLDSTQLGNRITVGDVREWHRRWLGNVYSWAGRDRSVNLGKAGFPFAPAAQVPRLMDEFDRNVLARYTPCAGLSGDELVEAIAVVHVELVLIHPFREGNGRLSRLLATVMAAQAGYPEPDFSFWDANRDAYFAAIHAGLANYEPMKALVRRVAPASGRIGGGGSSSPTT